MSTGWPEDWAARVAGRDCPLCASIGGGDNEHTLAVTTLGHTEVGLERGGALPGYCVVVWRHGHVAEPFELDAASAAGYWADVSAVGRAIAAEFRPVKVNYMTLGNWVPHLHTHVVPRYPDDPAPGGPIAFDALFAAERQPDDVLRAQVAALRHRLAHPSV